MQTDMQTETIETRASVLKPWLQYYSAKEMNTPLPRCTMYDMVRNSCKKMGKADSVALFYYGTKITYRQLFARIEDYAAAFAKHGVKKGDYVSFLTVSIPESICAIYALNKLGAVCNFIDVRTDVPHVREYIRKAKSDVLITLEQTYSAVADVLDDLGLRLVICQNPADSLPRVKRTLLRLKTPRCEIPYDGKRVVKNAQFAEEGRNITVPGVEYEPDMPAVVTRTGGTTGLSKGVVLTNDSMNAVARNFQASVMNKVSDTSSLLNFLPLGVSYGIAVGVHMALSMCFKDILIPKFDPNRFDQLVVRFKPNHIIAVPTFYQKLIASPLLMGADLSFIHTMAAGGDSANSSLEDKLEEFRLARKIPYPISQGYGLSETSSAVAFGFQNIHKKGSSGIPCLSSVIAAFRPGTTEELPIGEKGELCVSGATLMKEYLYEPEETAHVMWTHPDGSKWIHTGDVGYVDEDGFVFIVGRIKRSIIRFDGHKVYPLQLEQVVLRHPKVHNCVAVSVKDRQHPQGCLPLIAVQLTEQVPDGEALRLELLELCKQEMELRSQPADIVFVEEIPLTNMAKNDYRKLEERFEHYNYLKR